MRKPDFLIIGAPRAGTTWLWAMLDQHPDTALPAIKEPFFFSAAENYRQRKDWYYGLFEGIPQTKITGEGSTGNFYDRVPFFYNDSHELVHDDSLPVIPELIAGELPDVKIILCLRDPVERAISQFGLWRRKGSISPFARLRPVAETRPKMRIVEYGHYPRYLKLWKQHIPPERMCILIFEEDIARAPRETLRKVYGFLNLDREFIPDDFSTARNVKQGWSRLLLRYYFGKNQQETRDSTSGEHGRAAPRRGGAKDLLSRGLDIVDRVDVLQPFAVTQQDIGYLRSIFLPEKAELEALLGRPLDCWRYGSPGDSRR